MEKVIISIWYSPYKDEILLKKDNIRVINKDGDGLLLAGDNSIDLMYHYIGEWTENN